MIDLESNLSRLREVIAMKKEGYVLEGDALLAQVFAGMHPAALDGLLRSFDDAVNPQLTYAMIHAVEAWPDKEYCQALVRALPILWERSPLCAESLHIGVLNSPQTLACYLGVLSSSDSATKSTSRRIYQSITKKYPELAPKAAPVIEGLS